MNKPLPKAAIVAAIVVCAVLVVGAGLKFGSGEPPAKSTLASPYTKVGQVPPTAGAGVNSMTGEPLSETAKGYEYQSQQAHLGQVERKTP